MFKPKKTFKDSKAWKFLLYPSSILTAIFYVYVLPTKWTTLGAALEKVYAHKPPTCPPVATAAADAFVVVVVVVVV